MSDDEWEEVSERIPWQFRLVTPSGGRGLNHVMVLEAVTLPSTRVRSEGELLCVPHLTRHGQGKFNKILKTARIIGHATPTCTECVRVLRTYYGMKRKN